MKLLSVLLLKLLAIVHPLFWANLTNRGFPFDLFIGWLVLNRLWFTNQTIFLALVFGIVQEYSTKVNRHQ
ncbi:MAG TPA: hypothetical protein DCY88_09060 [Cyanobacteria bacterium UBA11372]|nr:hypothetical protein [Cyanobacteria bacterium UBA11372]